MDNLRGASFSAVLCAHTTIRNIRNAAFARRFPFLPVVGYSTVGISNSYTMVSLQWQTPDAKDIAINSLFNKEGLHAGYTISEGDQIQIWNGSDFDIYFYRAYKSGMPNRFTFEDSWVKSTAANVPTTATIAPGVGFWFKRSNSDDRLLTVAGGVKAKTNEKAITSSYTMMGSAFPTEMILNGTVEKPSQFDWKTYSHAGYTISEGDQIQVWNGSDFDIYFYRAYKSGMPNRFTYQDSWVKSTAANVPTQETIAPGKGFWYKRAGEYTTQLVETSPIAPKTAE